MFSQLNFRFIILTIVTSIIFGLLYNLFSPSGVELIRKKVEFEYAETSLETDDVLPESAEESIVSEPGLIMPEAAFELYRSNKILFIDARDQWDYSESHIKDAINIPEYKFDLNMPIVKALDKKFSFIIYCGDVECDVSKRLALKLSKIGFYKIYILEGGIESWKTNNYPMEQD